jgi:hypothetical protein
MREKASTARKLQLNAARQRRWRQRQRKVLPGDDHDERLAVIRACNAIVERLKDALARPPEEQNAKIIMWRLGLEQAIRAIEEYRREVQDFLV